MSSAVTGAMHIAGEAVFGDAAAFRASDPADGTALEPEYRHAGSKLAARAALTARVTDE